MSTSQLKIFPCNFVIKEPKNLEVEDTIPYLFVVLITNSNYKCF